MAEEISIDRRAVAEHGCVQCPRRCGAVRSRGRGRCGCDDKIRIAKTMLHMWEEPCVSGRSGTGIRDKQSCETDSHGTGAIFFTGCPLGCVYCQNAKINGGGGDAYTSDELVASMVELIGRGARNIDLVSPTQYAEYLIQPLADFKRLMPAVPIIWNTGGYELAETVASLAGFVDVYLTDFKYGSSEAAAKYSNAPDYVEVAASALAEMKRRVGDVTFDADGYITRGVIVRHLVLPNGRRDSVRALEIIADTVGTRGVLLSLMNQYTPDFAPEGMRELKRRVCSFEYDYVRDAAAELGFTGYEQERASATAKYTPEF